MNALTDEIERAISSGLYYLAIMSSLALPDICAALESPDGETRGSRYKQWCEQWFVRLYPRLTSDDLYYMRCGLVHQGRSGHPKSQYSRVIFTIPIASGNYFHNNVANDALNLDAPTFCRDMIGATTRWYIAKQADPNVVANLPRLMRLHPNGLAPYMVGMPVIA